ncbi:MAG: hypothetical protein JO361_01465, partial [Gammaproteobacteria bacterium]|nr:hypothetical protein [Gammaproteobacteria bacterium]
MAVADKPDFYVVGIGASAGGLGALRTFFRGLSATPGFACVVVVHLSPEHESHLVELLQPYTQMPVRQVVKTVALEPNHVYVIPPNANLNSIDTHLRLSELELRRVKRAPIDHFLRTLAETHGSTAIGVILTGAGSDGALGVRQIKEQGGLTIAQEPDEAEYSSMPQSAIATGTVDLVLPLREMGRHIERYCAMLPVLPQPGAKGDLDRDTETLLEDILAEVRIRTGQEFTMFSRNMVLQRVGQRMRLGGTATLSQYLATLRGSAAEACALYDNLLLNVTEFFRDTATYELLESVLGELLDSNPARLRVWSIGCSTGEEAYSLAILLLEQASRRHEQPALQVFATELSAQALQKAREGSYPQEIAANVSEERLARFFLHENGRYRVRRELRNIVTFAAHDLFKDPPYSHLDLIVCRTVIRDLQPEMRQGVLGLFYYALQPNGVLVVGRGGALDAPGFVPEGTSGQLLRRVAGPARPGPLPVIPRASPGFGAGRQGMAATRGAMRDDAEVFRTAVARFVPPSVLIDGDDQVVHFSASAARYVRIPGGELTLDILKLLPAVIAEQLLYGLRQVRKELLSWKSKRFAVALDGAVRRLTLHVNRTGTEECPSDRLLVVFD